MMPLRKHYLILGIMNLRSCYKVFRVHYTPRKTLSFQLDELSVNKLYS